MLPSKDGHKSTRASIETHAKIILPPKENALNLSDRGELCKTNLPQTLALSTQGIGDGWNATFEGR
jgi:hypothetical protein